MARGKPMKFGLSTEIIADFQRVFGRFPEIEQVLIFGSRAKNTFADGSDIDLAVCAPRMPDARFTELWNAIDRLPLVFKVDLLHWDRLDNAALKQTILTSGMRLHPARTESAGSPGEP